MEKEQRKQEEKKEEDIDVLFLSLLHYLHLDDVVVATSASSTFVPPSSREPLRDHRLCVHVPDLRRRREGGRGKGDDGDNGIKGDEKREMKERKELKYFDQVSKNLDRIYKIQKNALILQKHIAMKFLCKLANFFGLLYFFFPSFFISWKNLRNLSLSWFCLYFSNISFTFSFLSGFDLRNMDSGQIRAVGGRQVLKGSGLCFYFYFLFLFFMG